jgi:hypothetical protein
MKTFIIVSTIIFVFFSETNAVVNLNLDNYANTDIYKCQVKADPLYASILNENVDTIVIVFKNLSLESMLDRNSILIDNKREIMHQFNYHVTLNDYTFAYGSMAPLKNIFNYANISRVYNKTGEFQSLFDQLKEDLAPPELIDILRKKMNNKKIPYHIPLNNSTLDNNTSDNSTMTEAKRESKIFEVKNDDVLNEQIYKCVGKPFNADIFEEARNITFDLSDHSTSFLILKSTNETELYEIGDIIFGDESFGFLETIIDVEEIQNLKGEKKSIIKSDLTKCSDDEYILENLLKLKKLDLKKHDLNCFGGPSGASGLYVLNSSIAVNYKKEDLIGNLIVARETSQFAMKIIAKKKIDNFLVFEAFSITQLKHILEKTNINLNWQWGINLAIDTDLVVKGYFIYFRK